MVYYGLLLFFWVEYVRPNVFIPAFSLLHLNSVIPALVVVGSLFKDSPFSNRDALNDFNTRLMVCFMGLLALSVLTAEVTLYAYETFLAILGYALIYYAIARHISDDRQIDGVFKTLLALHVVIAALSPEMLTDPNSRSHGLVSGGFLGDGNDFALSVNIVIPLCLFLVFEAPKTRQKLLYLAGLLFMVLCVVATQSRGGTIALACVGIYYWLKSDRKLWMSVIAALVVALIFIYAPSGYFARMDTISSHDDGSSQGRIEAWGAAVNMAVDHPLLGVGAGHFFTAYGSKYRTVLDNPWRNAHSIYFQILGELGFPGAAVLILLIVSNLVSNWRLAKEIRQRGGGTMQRDLRLLGCLSAAMIAYATAGAFLTAVYYPHVFVLAGLCSAARHMARHRSVVATVPARAAAPDLAYHWALAKTMSGRRA